MSRPLKPAPSLKNKLQGVPEPDVVSENDVQKAAMSWVFISQVKPIIEACLDARVILNKFNSGELKAELDSCRSVLHYGVWWGIVKPRFC